MTPDTKFMVSAYALSCLRRDAAIIGKTNSGTFRHKAYLMANSNVQAFGFNGEPMDQYFTVGVHPSVYAGLVRVAAKLGVPTSCLGELVCTFKLEASTA